MPIRGSATGRPPRREFLSRNRGPSGAFALTVPLRVAFVYPHADLGPSGEGIADALAVVLVELGRRLVERGCSVTAFVRRRRGEPASSILDGIAVRRLHQLGDHLLFRLRVPCA